MNLLGTILAVLVAWFVASVIFCFAMLRPIMRAIAADREIDETMVAR